MTLWGVRFGTTTFKAENSDDLAIPTSNTNQDFPDDGDTLIFEDDEDIGDFNERANPDWNGG